MKEKYENLAKVRDLKIKYRKWKVKDKNKFLANKDNPIAVKEALVYDCIEDKKIALSEEEYKYMLMKIRESSSVESVSYNFECNSCKNKFLYKSILNEIMKPVFKKYGLIEFKDVSFQMGAIGSREHYENNVNAWKDNDQRNMVDFIMHIQSYNGDAAMKFEDLNDAINNIDIEVFEDIWKQWEEMKFKINNVQAVKCPKCKKEELYEFDDLPGFFSESWKI